MTNDKPREKRRVGFRVNPSPSPEDSSDAPDTSYMMLRDADAERIAERAHAHEAAAAALNNGPRGSEQQPSIGKFPKISARELAGMADKSLHKASAFGERAVTRAAGIAAPAAAAAKRVGRLPSLATIAGFGGKRAPGDPDDDDGDGNGGDNPDSSGRRPSSGPARPLRRHVDAGARVVHINDESKNTHFISNYVSTTKYSLWNAIPMFLVEQFLRFSNAYFLIVGIGYTIDAVTPIFTVGRYSTLWVLAVVVLISGVKEVIEDYHRYREDRRVNRAVTQIVGSRAEQDRWASVRVGDMIKVHEKEHLPSDIILVASSNNDGLAYIETKQLDGESNLKVKVVPQVISPAFSTDSVALLTKGRVECEAPNDRLYKFTGRMILESVPPVASSQISGDESDDSAARAHVPLNEAVSLGPENLLIRGSSIRNTDWVMGIVVNTGRDTKLMQNVKPRPRKNSRLERETNRHYLLTLLLQVCIVVALTIRSAQKCSDLINEESGQIAWYLLEADGCNPVDSFYRLFTFFITFSALIPISLYISMEIVRGFQVYFIERDQNIVDPDTDVKTEVRTSNLNEELGVVHHVFTDKTGTLTANKMEFKKCSIAGRVYEMGDIPNAGATSFQDLKDALQAGAESSAVRNFTVDELEAAETAFRLLSICHSVVAESAVDNDGSRSGTNTDEAGDMSSGSTAIRHRRLRRRRQRVTGESGEDGDQRGNRNRARQSSSMVSGSGTMDASGTEDNQRYSSSLNGSNNDSGIISYQASSPDEAALVNAARIQGFTYLSRSNRDTTVDVFGRTETHDLLETIEFDSTRKRMSVITRDPNGKARIYTKGADAIIFARLAPGQSSDVTEQHLHEFAVEGLRTLCLAYADLEEAWFEDWRRRYRHAASELTDREAKVAVVVDEIECNLTLLGATAIEDKLQEGVPETLKKLEQAGVKVWILTGDKQETAINIGLSCGAIDEGMDVVIINEDNLEDTAAQMDRALGRWSAMRTDPTMERKLGLVIDGQTLHYALEAELQKKFMVVTRMARSVIACRVSPKQKTEIVELVRRHDEDKVTLAIGDGANDVGMIQAAHVGVGIVGLEGQEAKLASDYSIGQFRFLARLMLVHGRWSYKRLSKMVLFTIYRNATLTLCELYWASFSAFSGQPLLDPWMGGLYNLLLTSLPPIVLGVFDQELVADYALAFPEIYSKGQRNTAYSFRVFLSWILSAIWQSAVIFFVCFWGFGDIPQAGGQMLGMWAFGTVVFSVVIFTVHVMLLVYQSSWTKLSAILYVLSFLTWFVIGCLFSWRPIALTSRLSPPLYAVIHRIFADPKFWLVSMLCPVLCVSPALLWKYSKRRRRPNMKMLVQELIRSGKTREQITGEPQKPIFRVPSYDPKRPGTPSGPVTFVVKGEREYLFSGFNFDIGESGAVLRHAFHSSRGVRRKRMRVLKRAGSDTELDVEGVKTAEVESPQYASKRTDEWVKNNGERYFNGPESIPDRRRRLRRPVGRDDHNLESETLAPPGSRGADANAPPQNATHRRAISDGAVLVEDRYERLDQRQHDGIGYAGGYSSSEDEIGRDE